MFLFLFLITSSNSKPESTIPSWCNTFLVGICAHAVPIINVIVVQHARGIDAPHIGVSIRRIEVERRSKNTNNSY